MIRILNKPTSMKLGGAETTLMNYYRNIDRSKIQFDFLMVGSKPSDHPYYYDEIVSLGAHIFYQPLRKKTLLKNIVSFYRFFKNNPEIKIIHIHETYAERCARITLLAKLAGVPVRIVHSRNALASPSFLHKLFRPIVRWTATHWLACSTEAGQSLYGKKYFKGEKAILFPNARDLEPFGFSESRRKNARESLGIDSQKVLLNVARLTKQKNQVFLLEAFALALKKSPDMVLLIAGGDWGVKPNLIQKIKELGISENVRILGERTDVPELLQAADLFVLPSLHEGLPGTAIEAQAAGLPCLLADTISRETKVTDLAEFLPIDNGPEIWARRIADDEFIRRDTVEDVKKSGYDVKDAAKRLEDFYFKIAR